MCWIVDFFIEIVDKLFVDVEYFFFVWLLIYVYRFKGTKEARSYVSVTCSTASERKRFVNEINFLNRDVKDTDGQLRFYV